MTTTTSNEAAERLIIWLAEHGLSEGDIRNSMDEALAAERRATVERIREALTYPERVGEMPNTAILLRDILAMLDEEAAR